MSRNRRRLHSAAEFRAVTRGGVRSARSHVVVHLSLLGEQAEGPRVGFVVSTKIGNAVVRNRVTRRLREILRDPLRQLPGGSGVVVRALPGVDALSFAQLSEEVLAALGGAARKLEHRGARTGTAR